MIRHARLDFHFNGNTDAFVLQQEVYEWFETLVNQMEPTLSRFTTDEIYDLINELVLDVDVSGNNWNQEATAKILLQLNDKLQLVKRKITHSAGYRVHTFQQHFEIVFLYFLRYGFLPWNGKEYSSTQWKEELEAVVTNSSLSFVRQLLEVFHQQPSSIQRFIGNVSLKQSIQLFTTQSAVLTAYQQEILHDTFVLFQQLEKAGLKEKISFELYRFLLSALVSQKGKVQEATPESELNKEQLQVFVPILYTLKDKIKNVSFKSTLFQQLQSSVIRKRIKSLNEIPDTETQQSKPLVPQIVADEETEVVYVSNAGLVIIAAFLPVFFDKIKLLTANGFTDVTKAVCLINYTATGSTVMMEYELVLPKILCGIPLNYPLQTQDFRVDMALQKEVTAMLNSVIKYWNILQNTSINGLRESFLKRKGKLSLKNNEWYLQVEQQSYDMLLQHLPWNISIIRLPWMKQILKTEWNY